MIDVYELTKEDGLLKIGQIPNGATVEISKGCFTFPEQTCDDGATKILTGIDLGGPGSGWLLQHQDETFLNAVRTALHLPATSSHVVSEMPS
jgi:hypothetical protein